MREAKREGGRSANGSKFHFTGPVARTRARTRSRPHNTHNTCPQTHTLACRHELTVLFFFFFCPNLRWSVAPSFRSSFLPSLLRSSFLPPLHPSLHPSCSHLHLAAPFPCSSSFILHSLDIRSLVLITIFRHLTNPTPSLRRVSFASQDHSIKDERAVPCIATVLHHHHHRPFDYLLPILFLLHLLLHFRTSFSLLEIASALCSSISCCRGLWPKHKRSP